MNTHTNIIGFLGSSRADGETAALAGAVFSELDSAVLADLSVLTIGAYSYDNAHAADDFPPLAPRRRARFLKLRAFARAPWRGRTLLSSPAPFTGIP